MGTMIYGLCHDCREYIDLDKFYTWLTWREAEINDLEVTRLKDYKQDGFIYRVLRLLMFLGRHLGHRLDIQTEHDTDCWEPESGWKEVLRFPQSRVDIADTVDFTDPNADRLIVKTRYGDVYLDIRADGLNCFRFEGDTRIDTLLLQAKKGE